MVSCGKCAPLANCAMGDASECGHQCSSRGYKRCAKRALQKRACQRCGGALPPLKKKGDKKKKRRPK